MPLRADFQRLLKSSTIYGFGNVLIRGISFMLVPLYTRWLTPADYGINGITTSVAVVLGMFLGLGLHGSVTRFYYAARTPDERRDDIGTIVIAMAVFGLVGCIGLELVGPRLAPIAFAGLGYSPYLRIAVWTAFFNTLGVLPPLLLQLRQEATRFVGLIFLNTILTIGAVAYFVAIKREGAYGYLRGSLYAAMVMTVPNVLVIARDARPRLRWPALTSALRFGVPLVPHMLSTWVLDLSDRAILQRYVSLADQGIYSLGYQFGLVMLIVASSGNSAWNPYFIKKAEAEGDACKPELSKLVTFYVFALCGIALAGALISRDVVVLVVPPRFHRAADVVPWVIGGCLWSAFYYIPASFVFFTKQTKYMGLITTLAGLTNIALNLSLVPKYGIMAACWSTFASYAIMFFLYFAVAQKYYRFPYDYRRISTYLILAASLYAVGRALDSDSPALDLVVKAAVVAVFPALLFLTRQVDLSELTDFRLRRRRSVQSAVDRE